MNASKKFDFSCRYLPEKIVIISVEGYLDSRAYHKFGEFLEEMIKSGRVIKIVVNMLKLQYISSAGVGLLMTTMMDLVKEGGDMKLCNLSPKMANFFDMLGFSRILKIMKSEEEAVKLLREKKIVCEKEENDHEEA